MRLFITGATGLIGRRLVLNRLERGDSVWVLSRDPDRADRLFAAEVNPRITIVQGDPAAPGTWQEAVSGCDVVVNLAGANIAEKRWTPEIKRGIVNSRVDGTHQVVAAIEAARERPSLLVNASAVGYYGETGHRAVDETAGPGNDFLADLCVRWEAQALKARELGVRTVVLRIGAVLDDRGGALAAMLGPFRLGLGGPIGLRRGYMPWIHYRDLINLLDRVFIDPRADGPINAVAPVPATNREFARALARALGRPAILPVPGFALRLAIGEFGRFAAASQRVLPAAAVRLDHHYLFPNINDAVASLISEIQARRQRSETADVIAENVSAAAPPDLAPDPPLVADVGSGAAVAVAPAIRTKPKRLMPRDVPRLLAIDIDGTMLRSDGRLDAGVIDACRAAERGGCVVVPASARPPRTVRSLIQTLGTVGPSINYNGAVIWNPLENTPQFHQPLDTETTRAIIGDVRAMAPESILSVEILDRWYTDRIDTRNNRADEPDYIGNLDAVLTRPVTKLDVLLDHARYGPVLEMIRERYWSTRQVAVFQSEPGLLQIVHSLVDKSTALQRIAARLGATRDQVVAIGDGSNDAGMIEWAGFGIAVGNACEAIIALADVVVPSNDDHGVARAIQRYVLSDAIG